MKAPKQIKAIQNRVVKWLYEESKGYLPLVSLDNCLLSFVCDNNSKFPSTKTITVTLTNEGDDTLEIEMKLSESELFQSSSFEVSVDPMDFKLQRKESMRLTFTWTVYKPLLTNTESLFHLEVKKKMKKRSKKQSESVYTKLRLAILMLVVPTQKVLTNAKKTSEQDNSVIKSLIAYTPHFIRKFVTGNSFTISEPILQKLSGSILFIDISGFTSLNEQLAKLGPAGPEAVSKHINNYFARIIEVVHKYKGDVLKFAGDALICSFVSADVSSLTNHMKRTISKGALFSEMPIKKNPIKNLQKHLKILDRNSEINSTEDISSESVAVEDENSALEELVLRSIRCGMEIQEKYPVYDSNEGFTLKLHIGIGAGKLNALHVGGVDGNWEFLVIGDPLRQLETAVHSSQSGQVVVSSFCWQLVKDKCEGKPLFSSPSQTTASPSENVTLNSHPNDDSIDINDGDVNSNTNSNPGNSNNSLSSASLGTTSNKEGSPNKEGKKAKNGLVNGVSFAENKAKVSDYLILKVKSSELSSSILERDSSHSQRGLENVSEKALDSSDDLLENLNEDFLRAYVPRYVQERIDSYQTEWIAELRQTTVVFIKLPQLNFESSSESFEFTKIHESLKCMQAIIFRFEGIVRQFLVDGKSFLFPSSLSSSPIPFLFLSYSSPIPLLFLSYSSPIPLVIHLFLLAHPQ